MALRNVVTEGDEVLRKHCREVAEVTDRIRMTMEDMLETMRAHSGVGIAAPQVGVLRRMFVAEPEPGRVYYMINTVILEQSGSQLDDEGCLSVPGKRGVVARPAKVTVRALNRRGELKEYAGTGLLARAFCHEIDHLDGILYLDKVIEEVFEDEE